MSRLAKATLTIVACLLVLTGLVVFASYRPELGWPAVSFYILAAVTAAGRWADHWRRRAFDPVTAEDKARALDRQILQTKIAVGIFLGIGALILLLCVVEWLG